MSFNARGVLILTLGSILGLQIASRGDQQEPRTYPIGAHNEDAVLKYLRPALRSTGYVGRLNYGGSCSTEGTGYIAFPQVVVHSPQSSTALGAVREMFQGDANVQVIGRKDKTVSITVDNPLTAVLQVKISSLRLTEMARYNPSMAIGAVENTREVQSKLSKLGLQVPPMLSEQLLAKPSNKGLPHLPAVITNLTVDQVLDSIASTFKGIVVYGTCAQSNGNGLLEIDFTGLEE